MADERRQRMEDPAPRAVLRKASFSGKPSTPWSPDGSVHDFMHAKCVVADDVVFVGSFNLSRSGERNAENVLEIESAAIADTPDRIRRRRSAPSYPPATVPAAQPAAEADDPGLVELDVRRRLVVLAAVALTVAGAATAARLPGAAHCRVFPAANPWNQRVDTLPVATNSKAIVSSIGATGHLHPDFGSGLWDGSPIGIPITVVGARPRARRCPSTTPTRATRARTRSRRT